ANKVVPRAELADAAREMADQVALVPPATAQAVKDSINRMLDLQGQRESWRYHFMVPQYVSNTATALHAPPAPDKGGMEPGGRAQQGGNESGCVSRLRRAKVRGAPWHDRAARGGASPGPGDAHRGAVLRRSAGRDGRRGRQDRAARPGRLHARDRSVHGRRR